MKPLCSTILVTGWILSIAVPTAAQHDHMNMDMPMKESGKMPARSALPPAEGASVKIITPKSGQVVTGDAVPLEFKLIKGRRGDHVHAYIDGEMVGMFKPAKGTLNGIKPGRHTLELRVVTADHNTELDATDAIAFTVK